MGVTLLRMFIVDLPFDRLATDTGLFFLIFKILQFRSSKSDEVTFSFNYFNFLF